MSRQIWCVVLLVGLGAGIVVLRNFKPGTPSTKNVAASSQFNVNAVDSAPRCLTLEEALALDLSKSNATNRPTLDVNEPIVTRLEPVEDDSDSPSKLASISGGAEESDADALRGPRPDIEARRMPYADDEDETVLSRLFGWIGLRPHIAPTVRFDPTTAEESEEPPILEPVLPMPHHPAHCPFGGHCPYPFSYRMMQPR